MLKSDKFAITLLVVAATALSIAGCRSGGGNPAQGTFGSSPSFSQGSGTASAPSYGGGGSGSVSSPSYDGGGGSGARSYGGGGGSGGR